MWSTYLILGAVALLILVPTGVAAIAISYLVYRFLVPQSYKTWFKATIAGGMTGGLLGFPIRVCFWAVTLSIQAFSSEWPHPVIVAMQPFEVTFYGPFLLLPEAFIPPTIMAVLAGSFWGLVVGLIFDVFRWRRSATDI